MKKKQGYFSISAVAKMFSVHQQTIRLYEKEGFINPKRSTGNTRMFCEEDVDKLEEIIYLTHQLGINLAGVEMILKLQKQIKKMQRDMNKMFKEARTNLTQETELRKNVINTHIQQFHKLKESALSKANAQQTDAKDSENIRIDIENLETNDWKMDYDQ